MFPVRFYISGWSAWHDDGRGNQSSVGDSPDIESRAEVQAEDELPLLLRRRVTPVGRRAMRAAYKLSAPRNTRFVSCSRHGEFARTVGLLSALAGEEPLSPSEFSLSVHHALLGLLSIARRNMSGHTAVAAGTDSFGFGLLEALALLIDEPRWPVLLVYYDEPLCQPYAELDSGDGRAIALGVLLSACQPDRERRSLTIQADVQRGSAQDRATTGQAMDFVHFLSATEETFHSRGAGIDWRWARAA
jgi:hypothetical protein